MSKSILFLRQAEQPSATIEQLSSFLIQLGAQVVSLQLRPEAYNEILDAVATCDSVVFWPDE